MFKSPEQKKKEKRAFRMLVLITQIGICMMVPIFFCVFLGRWISERTGQPLFFLLLLVIGAMAGFRSSWQIISRFTGPLKSAPHQDSSPYKREPDGFYLKDGSSLEGERDQSFAEDDEGKDMYEVDR